jgi:hypothetical protein
MAEKTKADIVRSTIQTLDSGPWLDDFAYDAAARRRMAKSGEAMPDGSYPIANCSDAENAIRSQGRGQTAGSQAKVVAHIRKRVGSLGCSGDIFTKYK